jgi:hypothetical protein
VAAGTSDPYEVLSTDAKIALIREVEAWVVGVVKALPTAIPPAPPQSLDQQVQQVSPVSSATPQTSWLTTVIDTVVKFGQRAIPKKLARLYLRRRRYLMSSNSNMKSCTDYAILPKDHVFPASDPEALKRANSDEKLYRSFWV